MDDTVISFVSLGAFLFGLWLTIRILNKAGYSEWWAAILFVPLVNIIMIWVFAFAKWPVLNQRRFTGTSRESDGAVEHSPSPDFHIDEDALHARVWEEIESGDVNKGLWAKAFAKSDGDINKTRAAYIRDRVEEELIEEEQRIHRKKEEEKQEEIKLKQKEECNKARFGGAVISRPRMRSRAEKAGLIAGDAIIEYNNKDIRGVNSVELLTEEAEAAYGNDKIKIIIERNGELKEMFIAGGNIGANFT